MARYAAFVILFSSTVPAWAAANASAFLYAPVPTLDETGLGALIALVAGVAGWALGRRGRR